MTTVALREATLPAQPLHVPSSLTVWAQEAREAANVAISLAKTPFVPASLRERPTSGEPEEIARAAGVTAANITAAILTGQEIGLEPMAALRSIDVIQGTPALRAVALRAIVLSAGHDMWVEEANETRAIVAGKRAGSEHIQRSTWTLDRARALNLLGKDNWKKQPGAMLVARASGECARLVAADALLGVPYAAEELQDGLDSTDVPASAPEPVARRTARRRTAPVAVPVTSAKEGTDAARPADPEPEFDEPSGLDEFAPETTSNPEPISEAQRTKLHATFGDLGVTKRDDKIRAVKALVGRDVESSNDLTKPEATKLIDALTTASQQDDPVTYLAAIIEMAEAER